MLKVERVEGETIEHLLRRYSEGLKRLNFFKLIKNSGVKNRKVSKRQRKNSALYKLRKREKMEYLKRIGKIEENSFSSYHGQRWGRAQ